VRFYLQELLWRCGEEWAGGAFGQTNQVALADAIERWRRVRNEEVTYITFNYDLMLERALSPFLPIGSFGDYVKGPTCLIKAHGSADLGASLRNPQPTYSG
jgi:hypothetical protein